MGHGFFNQPGSGPQGNGFGLYPTEVRIQVTVQGAAGLRGQCWMLDLEGSDAAVDPAANVHDADGIYVNVIKPTADAIRFRQLAGAQQMGVFCVLEAAVADGGDVFAIFYGRTKGLVSAKNATDDGITGQALFPSTDGDLIISGAVSGDRMVGWLEELTTNPGIAGNLKDIMFNGFVALGMHHI